MALDKEGNAYTFGFSVIMVILVAALLSFAALGLKPFQEENVRREKMQNILSAIRVECERDQAPELFAKYVREERVLNSGGQVIEGMKAFGIDVQKEYKTFRGADEGKRNYPMYICEKEGSRYYVIPMVGTGLWGPVWGYVSLEDDLNTVYGATFDHKSETPGLGAEIKEKPFELQFQGDQIFDESGNFSSILVVKGGADPEDKHGVDAITGGTITSNGVTEMLQRTLKVYESYFRQIKSS